MQLFTRAVSLTSVKLSLTVHVSGRQQIYVHLNSLIYISSNPSNRFAVYYMYSHLFL